MNKELIEECEIIAICKYTKTKILKGISGNYYAMPYGSFNDIGAKGELYWYKNLTQEGLLFEWHDKN